jgi:2-polyprenyl-3-methyl-5-hydroxy-6-metoxy-1,4-benzoquinol methylase
MAPYGVEPNLVACEAARAKGLTVVCGTLEDGRFPDRHFDLITMNHVFEHVDDPSATLIEASRILRLGGTLIIATPNADSLLRRLFGKYWFQLDAPRHLQVYTIASIARLARVAEFEITSVRWTGHPVALTASLYNLFRPRGTHTPRTVLHKLLVGPPIQWLALPLTAITNALRLGDTIEVRMTIRTGRKPELAREPVEVGGSV